MVHLEIGGLLARVDDSTLFVNDLRTATNFAVSREHHPRAQLDDVSRYIHIWLRSKESSSEGFTHDAGVFKQF